MTEPVDDNNQNGPVDVAAYLGPQPRPAQPIELTDPTDAPFSLASLRGAPTFVFFGYTHCPDVCPATIGTVGLAIEAFGTGPRAVFVSIDPERDTTAWLTEYVRYLPAGFAALTGTSAQIQSTADAWGVRYARVETGVAGCLLDVAHGRRLPRRRRRDPASRPIPVRDDVRGDDGGPPVGRRDPGRRRPDPAAPTATRGARLDPAVAGRRRPPSGAHAGRARPWMSTSSPRPSGPASRPGHPAPVRGRRRLDDTTIRPTVQLVTVTGDRIGAPVEAVPVRPPGVSAVSYVATLADPDPGRLARSRSAPRWPDGHAVGSAALDVLDPGTTAAIGAPAPTVRTPTLTDVGGVVRAVTTDPAPDLRLSQRSTSDALAAGQPFVLVVDSSRFRVSPACGRAIVMARYLLDRWRDVAFIHLEPYRYSVVADTAVLDGTLEAPTLTDPAAAWGIGGDPWGPRSMPWVFVVDGHGIVRAKYQGVMGTDDVDVILALIAQGG